MFFVSIHSKGLRIGQTRAFLAGHGHQEKAADALAGRRGEEQRLMLLGLRSFQPEKEKAGI
jgi:hypothetical protein